MNVNHYCLIHILINSRNGLTPAAPLHQSVHTTVMYIMYLFQVLQEDLCSFVLNQKKSWICMWSHVSTSITLVFFCFVLFCFFCCCYIKKNTLNLKLKLLQGITLAPTFIPLFVVVSFLFFWLQRQMENCKWWHYLYCTWWFSYIFIAYQRVLHLTKGLQGISK